MTPATPEEALNTTLQGAVDTAVDVINTNMPLVFTVLVAFLVWNIGRRVFSRI